MQVAGVVNREAELRRRLRRALTEHNKLMILQIDFSAQLRGGLKQQINFLSWIFTAANFAKQQLRAIMRQAKKLERDADRSVTDDRC